MAITRDSVTNFSASSNGVFTYGISHTCSGSDRILFVSVFDRDGDNAVSLTYNSVPMTQVAKKARNNDPSSQGMSYLYMLVAPSTGANTITYIRSTNTNQIALGAVSYNGAKQTGQPDASATLTNSSTTATLNITTVADNCAVILFEMYDGAGAATAGAGATLITNSALTYMAAFESSSLSLSPAGAKSLITNLSASGVTAITAASFAPSASVSSPNSKFFMFMPN